MGLNLKNVPRSQNANRVEQPVLEVGTYPARLVQIIDCGIQPQKPYQGNEKPPAHEVRLTYELLDVFMIDEEGNEEEDRPRWVSETITLASPDKDLAKSTKRYKALDPDIVHDYDFTKLIGYPCMITIAHGANKKNPDRPYENIGNVTTMRKAQADKAVALKNEPKVFVLDEPNLETFLSLPTWMQDYIKSNLQYAGSALEKALAGHGPAKAEGGKPPVKKAAQKPVQEEPEHDDEGDEPW